MTNTDLPYWLALSRFRKFGPVRMKKLIEAFDTMCDVFHASVPELVQAEIEPRIAKQFCSERSAVDLQKELALLKEHGVAVVTIKDPAYPPLLKEIYDPPAILFYRGTLPNPEHFHLAVIGSRKPSLYGKQVVKTLVEPLAQTQTVIVSGLAYGIDAIAHKTTIDVQGTTVAVLGCGVDQNTIYPTANRLLAKSIIDQGGAVLSEFPIGTPPLKQHFPFRNRIIAGMCKGTLVIEAAQKSGSLITARLSLESGRDVYAVPGPIHSPLSAGPNNLLKMGAIAVTQAKDILPHLYESQSPSNKTPYQPGSAEEATIYKLLSIEPQHLDELTRQSTLPSSKVTSTLTLMEMKGSATHVGGQYYVRAS